MRAPAPPTQYFIRAMRQFRDDANCFSIRKIERLVHCAWASRRIDRADKAIPIGSVPPPISATAESPEPCPSPGRIALESGPRALESSLRQPQEPQNQRTESSAEGGANEKGQTAQRRIKPRRTSAKLLFSPKTSLAILSFQDSLIIVAKRSGKRLGYNSGLIAKRRETIARRKTTGTQDQEPPC